ncbi:MAG TPA: transcription elongation factor GreA [Candidatus Absconditabacterales bacterium]|nr:transcription elongation factor GreA [Candidatus Absconditabacterales bacterium]
MSTKKITAKTVVKSPTKSVEKKTVSVKNTGSSKSTKGSAVKTTVTSPSKKTVSKTHSSNKKDIHNLDSLSIDFVEVIPDDTEEEVVIESKKKEISHVGYKKLLDELSHLEVELLPAVNERIKEAREYGDLSENAEYQSAINEKQMIDVRIVELKDIIANSLVVDSIKKSNTVQYGSMVTIEFVEDKSSLSLKIVGSAEISFEHEMKHISFDSPIGLAIEGKKVGDICKVRAERGRFDVKIISIN